MYYCLYQITNLVNGKIYVGAHKTNDLEDGYLGSGKAIRAAIQKYGKENFRKTILEITEDETQMYLREAEIVTELFVKRDDTYNLVPGGVGGLTPEAIRKGFEASHTPECIQRRAQIQKENGNYDIEVLKSHTPEACQKRVSTMKQNESGIFSQQAKRKSAETRKEKMTGFLDSEVREKAIKASMTEENIQKRVDARRQRGDFLPENTSQFGTMWITNGIESRKIGKDDIIPEGWRKGRVIKKTKEV